MQSTYTNVTFAGQKVRRMREQGRKEQHMQDLTDWLESGLVDQEGDGVQRQVGLKGASHLNRETENIFYKGGDTGADTGIKFRWGAKKMAKKIVISYSNVQKQVRKGPTCTHWYPPRSQ